MPNGIILMKWNERSATEILFKYPTNKDFQLSKKTLLHILNLHGFNKKPGIASLTTSDINFLTYYSGAEKGYYIILLLNILEIPDDYEENFKQLAPKIINKIEKQNYKKTLPSLYNKLT